MPHHSSRGDHEEAALVANQATTLLEQAQMPNMQGESWMAVAQVSQAAGHVEEASEAA